MNKFYFLAIAALAVAASAARAASPLVVLSEWNAVGDTKYLGSTASDTTFFDSTFKALGAKDHANGGNWIELRVVGSGIDITGWKLEWENADPDSGSVTFTDDSVFESVAQGTLITIIEAAVDEGENFNQYGFGTTTDVSGSVWNIPVDNDTYVTHSGGFKVDNDDWKMRIKNAGGTVIQGWVGEGQTGWIGGGIGDDEVGALTVNPITTDISAGNYYDDFKNSSFGSTAAPNGG